MSIEEFDQRLESMTEDEAKRWELEILSQHHKDQADRAVNWLAKQGYWITEITKGDGSAREFTINFGAVIRHCFDTDMIEFAQSKRWIDNPVGTSRRPDEEEK